MNRETFELNLMEELAEELEELLGRLPTDMEVLLKYEEIARATKYKWEDINLSEGK